MLVLDLLYQKEELLNRSLQLHTQQYELFIERINQFRRQIQAATSRGDHKSEERCSCEQDGV